MARPTPKPSQTRKVEGNPGKRAYNKREPQLAVRAPAMPADLDEDGTAEWGRLVAVCLNSRVLTVADRGIVEAAAQAYSTFIRATRAVNQHGLIYETENTTGGKVLKARPEVAIASDAWRRYRAAICELGLTPAARTRVEAASEELPGDPAAGYFN